MPQGPQAQRWRKSRLRGRMALGWLCTLVLSIVAAGRAGAAEFSPAASAQALRAATADFQNEPASDAARAVADRVLATGDHQQFPFLIVDKKEARVYVFDRAGRLTGAASALVGTAVGDDAVPGIGDRPLASIRPQERTTPAGRFVAALDASLQDAEVLWIDHDGGVALHRLGPAPGAERRPERLASRSPADNRITYGCINVTGRFYDAIVNPAFKPAGGIVYVLPETRSLESVFPFFR